MNKFIETPRSDHPDVPDIFTLDQDHLALVRQYYRLACLPSLSTLQELQLLNILEEAESDGLLDFWINEIDHILAHELNLVDNDTIKSLNDQQAKMREYLHLYNIRDVQEKLKSKGFDPGPVDGLEGKRTKTAIRNFQSSQKLETSGCLNEETLDALYVRD